MSLWQMWYLSSLALSARPQGSAHHFFPVNALSTFVCVSSDPAMGSFWFSLEAHSAFCWSGSPAVAGLRHTEQGKA